MIARAGVELSDEQVEKLAEIKGDGYMDFAGGSASMMTLVRDMVRAFAKPELDKERIRAMHKDLQAKRNQMGDQFIERMIAAAEVLTPDQRQQVRMHMLRQMLGLGHEHEEHGPPSPPPPFPPEGPRPRRGRF
jgi:Spy/CpxP family protein refolding chaperone